MGYSIYLFSKRVAKINREPFQNAQEKSWLFLWFLFTSLLDEGNLSILRKKIREYRGNFQLELIKQYVRKSD